MCRQSCPICNCLQIIPLLEHFRVSAQVGEDSLDVQGLWGFVCEAQGHIFFVRISDVKKAQRSGRTTMPPAISCQNRPGSTRTAQRSSEFEEEIRIRAYELYEQRGGGDGHDIDDWLQAESEMIPMRKAARAA